MDSNKTEEKTSLLGNKKFIVGAIVLILIAIPIYFLSASKEITEEESSNNANGNEEIVEEKEDGIEEIENEKTLNDNETPKVEGTNTEATETESDKEEKDDSDESNTTDREEITLEGIVKGGDQVGKTYCTNGFYLTESGEFDYPLYLRTSDDKRDNKVFEEYQDKSVTVKGYYPPEPPIDCTETRCACDDYIAVTSIEIN